MAADTHSEYVLLIFFLPRNQWIKEGASILRDTCIACLVGVKLEGTYTGHQALNG